MKQNNIQFENSNLNRRHVLKLQFHQNILFEPLAPTESADDAKMVVTDLGALLNLFMLDWQFSILN